MAPENSSPQNLSLQNPSPLIDTHLHAVGADRQRYRLNPEDLPGNSWVHTNPTTAEDLVAEMDSAGVQAGVLVQPVGAYGVDNSYIADAIAAQASSPAQPSSPQLVGVCVIDMTSPDRLDKLRFWTQQQKLSGVRLFSIPTPDIPWLDNPETFEVWRACAEWGVRVSVCLLPAELSNLDAVLAQFPEIPVALDHCGFVDFGAGPGAGPDAGPSSWHQAEPLFRLAERPNLHLKVTTNVLESAGQVAPELLAELNRRFGSQRLMWGSDFPQTHHLGYPQLVKLARNAASGLPTPAQADYLGLAALRLWPELAPPKLAPPKLAQQS